MLHNVTIPFCFDTSPIEEQIANIGATEVGKAIGEVVRKGVFSVMPKKGYYGYGKSHPASEDEIDWAGFVKSHFYEFMDEHKDEVIDEAALLLAMKASRKKSWRETLEELKAERDAE